MPLVYLIFRFNNLKKILLQKPLLNSRTRSLKGFPFNPVLSVICWSYTQIVVCLWFKLIKLDRCIQSQYAHRSYSEFYKIHKYKLQNNFQMFKMFKVLITCIFTPSSFPSAFSSNNNQSATGGASISVPILPLSGPLPSNAGNVSSGFTELQNFSGSRKARVLYDYDAASSSELSLLADEVGVFLVTQILDITRRNSIEFFI